MADYKTGRGEEVEEGFVGWMKLETEDAPNTSRGKGKRRKEKEATPGPEGGGTPNEVQVRGVRVCRECWSTVSSVVPIPAD